MILRTKKTQEKYDKYKKGMVGCGLCDGRPIRLFPHYKILKNRFPYDTIARKHDLLVVKNHGGTFKHMQPALRSHIFKNYDFVMASMPSVSSVPKHKHLHLIKLK